MAENIPSMPGGAVPPKPPEGSKVQPKKETVRINLPPKPSAAPTIKLPTLPPGGPSAGAPASFPPPAPTTAAPGAPRTAAAPAAAPTAQRPTQQRPLAPAKPAVTGFDKVLAIVAIIAIVAALASTGSAAAEPSTGFFAGKQITMIVPSGVGGGYDLYGRFLAARNA